MVLPVVLPAVPEPAVTYRLSFENLKSIEQTIKHLKLRAYSDSTIRTYRGELIVFFRSWAILQPPVLPRNTSSDTYSNAWVKD